MLIFICWNYLFCRLSKTPNIQLTITKHYENQQIFYFIVDWDTIEICVVSVCTAVRLSLQPVYLNSVSYQLCVEKTLCADCAAARCRPISLSGSWWQVLYITGGAKEMTSCPCRGWKRSPDRTVMTKEFLGNIRVHRRQGEKKKKCLGAVFS